MQNFHIKNSQQQATVFSISSTKVAVLDQITIEKSGRTLFESISDLLSIRNLHIRNCETQILGILTFN